MAPVRTTRCCSAVALILGAAALAAAPAPPKELPFFPTRAVWSLPLNNPLTQPPAYDAGHAYFPIAGARLLAYDIKPGTLLWTAAATPTMPIAAGDDLIFVVEEGAVVALRALNGSPAWRTPLLDELAVPPVWDNGWLILAGKNGTIVALRARDGQVIWSHSVGAPPHARPALAADRVYVPASNGRVVALNVSTGEELWTRKLGDDANDILALDDRIFVGSKDNYAYAINAETGAVEWRYRFGADVIGVPAHDDTRVYFVSFDNTLRAFNRRSGVQYWIKQLPLRPNAGPVRAGTTIIVSGQTTSLPTFNAKDGAPVGALTATPELAVPPQIVLDRETGLPGVLVLTKDIVKGATVSLVTRGIDPSPAPIAPLPGSLTTVPTLASPGSPGALRPH